MTDTDRNQIFFPEKKKGNWCKKKEFTVTS